MKKTLFCLIVLAFMMGNANAIGKKYDSKRYEILPVSVNSTGFDFGISYYRENTVAYFQTDSTVADMNDKKMPKKGIVIYKANLAADGNLTNAEVAQELMDLGVSGSFAYDKKKDKIYFSRFNTTNRVYQLFESTYTDGEWETPKVVVIEGLTPSRKNMSAIENANWDYIDKGASIAQPALAKNGTRLYFASNIKGGAGKTDIWYSDFNAETETWGAPVNVGKGVNTEASEQYPFPLGDSILYFASNYGSEEVKFDLFVARFAEGQDSLANENMGEFFNTPKNEYNVLTNGNYFLFVAEKDSSLNDEIMYVKPFPLLDLKELAMAEPVALGEIVEFNHVLFLFDFDKSNLKPEFESQLEQIIEEMKLFPGQKFEIAGYTDERGSDKYNERLSQRRAKTVYDLLVKRGADKNSLVLKAYGKTHPVVPNAQTEEDHAKNRRVEINIYNEQ
jgi:outer membrane protein OmpA-like peptidoglycan-associated protein